MNEDETLALGDFIATERDKYPRRADDMDSWDLAEAIAGSAWLAGLIRQAKAEALEEAANKATDPMWVLFDSDYDNALVAAWLQGRAEDIKKEEQ